MNYQLAFNLAYIGVVKQGRPSVTAGGAGCRYTSEKVGVTLHCGVGHLFPADFDSSALDRAKNSSIGVLMRAEQSMADDDNDDETDNTDFKGLIEAELAKQGLTDLDVRFLQSLQNAHDNNINMPGLQFIQYFKESMKIIADTKGLTIPEVV